MKINDELRCSTCGRKLSKAQPLFDTAWLGIHWCGDPDCAVRIMEDNCEEFDPNDDINWE